MNQCDSALHEGERVPATYLVQEGAREDRLADYGEPTYRAVAMGRAYACCDEHLDHAVRFVLGKGATHAVVRREAPAASATP